MFSPEFYLPQNSLTFLVYVFLCYLIIICNGKNFLETFQVLSLLSVPIFTDYFSIFLCYFVSFSHENLSIVKKEFVKKRSKCTAFLLVPKFTDCSGILCNVNLATYVVERI